MDSDAVRARIESARPRARVRARPRRLLDVGAVTPTQIANALIVSEGLQTPANWYSLTREDALKKLSFTLAKDMAYGTPILPEPEATEHAQLWLALYGATAQHLTNNDPRGFISQVSSATFEFCLVSVATDLVGLVLIEDED